MSGLHCSIWNFLCVIQKTFLENSANVVNCVALTFSEQGLGREYVVWGKGLCLWCYFLRGGGLNVLNSEVVFYVSEELLGSQL